MECPNCGEWRRAEDVDICVVCKKETCLSCSQILLFKAVSKQYALEHYVVVCSEGCWKVFLDRIKGVVDSMYLKGFDLSDSKGVLESAYKSYIRETPSYLEPDDAAILQRESTDVVLIGEGRDISNRLRSEERKTARQSSERFLRELTEYFQSLSLAKLLEKGQHAEGVGRYEDAADYYNGIASRYEALKDDDKARELRDKARELCARAPLPRETIGWPDFEDNECIRLVCKHLARSHLREDSRLPATGLLIGRADIMEVRTRVAEEGTLAEIRNNQVNKVQRESGKK